MKNRYFCSVSMPRAVRAIAAASCRHSVSANAHSGEISVVGTLRRSCAECVGFVRHSCCGNGCTVKLAEVCIFVSFCYGLATHSYRYHIGEYPSSRTKFVRNWEIISQSIVINGVGMKIKNRPLSMRRGAMDDDFGRLPRIGEKRPVLSSSRGRCIDAARGTYGKAEICDK